MQHLLPCLCVPLGLASCSSFQQPGAATVLESYGPVANDKLVTISTTYEHTQLKTEERQLGTSTTTTTYANSDIVVVSIAGSVFTTPADELGMRLEYQFANEFTSQEMTVFYNRNLMLNQSSGVYFGVSTGVASRVDGRDYSLQDGDLSWGVQCGYRNWISRSTVLFVQPRLTLTDSERDRSATEQTRLQVQMGFGLTF